MAFLKNRPLLNQFIQLRTYTCSMLWRRYSSFRQVMPKFPYPSAVNMNRHQVVKPRPPPMSSDVLAQMYPNKYMTPQLNKRKSRKYIAFLNDNDANLHESKDHKPKTSLQNTEQLRKLMFESGSDESIDLGKVKHSYARYNMSTPPKKQHQQQQQHHHHHQQQQQQHHHHQRQQQQPQTKFQQQEHKLYEEQQSSQMQQFRFKYQKQQRKDKEEERQGEDEDEAIIILPRPRPPKQQQQHQHQQQQHQQQLLLQKLTRENKKQQQYDENENVENPVNPGEEKSFGKKFKVQHENMQKIKERDRKLKDHVEKLKAFDRMNQLMKLQQEQEEREFTPYTPPPRPRHRDYRYNHLKSSGSHTHVATDPLRPLTSIHPVYTSRFKKHLDFAPYTPTNDQSDNGDVVTKQHRKTMPKLSPVTEFHMDKAAALEAQRKEQVNSRDSAMYKLCISLMNEQKSKF